MHRPHRFIASCRVRSPAARQEHKRDCSWPRHRIWKTPIAAEHFARENGIAFLPTIVCTPELLAIARSQIGQVVTAYISQPFSGENVSGGKAIQGSVLFTPDQAQFYKLELRGGPYSDWITLGDIHQQPVHEGQLEWLPVLPRGDYQLRLVVVGWDGNFVQPPYEVTFRVP